MMSYAVMGCPIEHSLSPLIHQYFAKQFNLTLDYRKILVEPSRFAQQVEAFFQAGGQGLNVTAPCKQQAFAICDEATSRSRNARAANTLWQEDGKLLADTTDGVGLIRDLSRYLDLRDKRVLILGAGGVVGSILEPLLAADPAMIALSNRTKAHAVELQAAFRHQGALEVVMPEQLSQSYDVIIHATPARETNWPKVVFQNALLAYDLTYHLQGLTAFVTYVRSLGCRAADGFGMLVHQAAESFKIWHGLMPDVSKLLDSRKILLI